MQTPAEKRYSIGQLADHAHCKVETVREATGSIASIC